MEYTQFVFGLMKGLEIPVWILNRYSARQFFPLENQSMFSQSIFLGSAGGGFGVAGVFFLIVFLVVFLAVMGENRLWVVKGVFYTVTC